MSENGLFSGSTGRPSSPWPREIPQACKTGAGVPNTLGVGTVGDTGLFLLNGKFLVNSRAHDDFALGDTGQPGFVTIVDGYFTGSRAQMQ